MIELAAVAEEPGTGIEQFAESPLRVADVLADAEPAAEFRTHPGGGGKMVGVEVGVDHPFHIEPLGAHEGHDCIGR